MDSRVHGMVWIALMAGVTYMPAAATAQPARAVPQVSAGERITREWALRGVIISDAARSAVLEHLPSGRQDLLRVGAAVTGSVSVVTIDPDRVVLSTEGGATVALRLNHGGPEAIGRPRLTPARGMPPPLGRRRAR